MIPPRIPAVKTSAILSAALWLSLSATHATSMNAKEIVEAEIRAAIGKPSGELTASDYAKVTELDLNGNRLNEEYDCRLTALTLPQGLVNLEVLDLRFNELSPSLFSPVTIPDDITNLVELYFDSNTDLSTISFLRNLDLSNLEILDLSTTAMTKIELADFNLPNLHTLLLQRNQRLTTLTLPDSPLTTLDLRFSTLTNFELEGGPGLSMLTELNLSRVGLENLTLRGEFESLERLIIDGNPLETVQLPPNLRKLRVIEAFDAFFAEDRISNLESFTIPEGYVNLEILDLDYNSELVEITLSEGLHSEGRENIDFQLKVQETDKLERLTIAEPLLEDQRLVFQVFDVLEAAGVEIVVTVPPTTITTPVFLESGDLEFEITGALRTFILYESVDLSTWTEILRFDNFEGASAVTVTPPKFPPPQQNVRRPAAYYRMESIPRYTGDE